MRSKNHTDAQNAINVGLTSLRRQTHILTLSNLLDIYILYLYIYMYIYMFVYLDHIILFIHISVGHRTE